MSSPPSSGGMPTIGMVVGDSLRLMRQQRDHLLRVGLVPIIIMFLIDLLLRAALDTVAVEPAGDGAAPAPDPRLLIVLLLVLLNAVPLSLFAVNWLRVLLLGPRAVSGLSLRWGLRETRFLLRGLLISLLAGLAIGLPMGLVMSLAAAVPGLESIVLVAAMLANIYVVLRLSFSLVALALDGTMSLPGSWQATRGVGGRLFLAVVAVAFPFMAAALVVPLLLDVSGLSAAAPLFRLLLETVLSLLVSAAGLTALAVVYMRLAGRPRGSV